MRHLLIGCLVAALVLSAGTASGVVFLYDDLESGFDDWWHLADDLWHPETYRSYSGNYSMAYNTGSPNYTYNTGGANYGILFTPAVDITGASALYDPPYRVEAGTISGGSYRLANFGQQTGRVAAGGAYRLLVPSVPDLRGSGCCCTYVPCTLRNR